jgi:hypothetical protein
VNVEEVIKERDDEDNHARNISKFKRIATNLFWEEHIGSVLKS